MRLAAAIIACVLAAPPASGETACGPDQLEQGRVARVGTGGDVYLQDGRILRLAGLHRPDQATVALRPGEPVAFAALDEGDRWSRLPAIIFALPPDAEPVWLQEHMARTGRSLVRWEPSLGPCWLLLKAAEAKAAALPQTLPEGGRFARIEGRVARVGDGRSARFVTVLETGGQRVTAMVQKRHLNRLKQGGVDVEALKGQIVRLRGVRGLRNPQLIAVGHAEQIEIVR